MRTGIVLICMLCLVGGIIPGEYDSTAAMATSSAQVTDPQFGNRRNNQSPEEARIERQMAKERNKDRQKKLQEDTDKLLKLATELKQYVDKTNEQILSVEVLKKTDEIEKLAKSVHNTMKQGSYDGVQYDVH